MKRTTRSMCVLVALVSLALPGREAAAAKLSMLHSSGDPLAVDKADRDPSDGWYGSLALVVRNTSDKPI